MATGFWWEVVMELRACGIWTWREIRLSLWTLKMMCGNLSQSHPPERWWSPNQNDLLNYGIQMLGRLSGVWIMNMAWILHFRQMRTRVVVLSGSLITLCDINNPENRLSFNPWPSGRDVRNWKVAFQTSDHVVICAELWRDDDDDSDGLLQVWHVTGPTRLFSLDIEITKYSDIFLAPDGLTAVIHSYDTVLSYSWNHDNAQFDPFHFASQEHLFGYPHVYSPDGRLVACCSYKDDDIRVWDTRTGQLCGNPITMPNVRSIDLSPAMNNQSLGNRLIAMNCRNTNTTSLFDVDTGHLYAQFWSQGRDMAFIRDGTKLMTSANPLIIRDTADLTVKHRDGYKLHPRNMKDGWMIGQDNESLFWVPVEHRENLCLLPQFEMAWGRSTKLSLYNFRYGNKWTECIDKGWLEELEDKEKKMGRLLGWERKTQNPW